MTISETQILRANQQNYEDLYTRKEAFLRYPADWVIRFHNMYLKHEVPSGRVLDYGCGAGNNSCFLIEQGYEIYGVDPAQSAIPLIKANLQAKGLDINLQERFSNITAGSVELPYDDNFFDFILSNQVLYYLPSEEAIRRVCKELSRCLRPGGVVFFTVMGPRNYYITHHTKQIHGGKIYDIQIDDPNHRLSGLKELIYLVRDEEELKDLFSEFECVTTGYFDQRMFDIASNFHWIFAGKKPPR